MEKLLYEEKAYSTGATFVCGCDEVGRGCLAGPVVSAAVYIPPCNYQKLAHVDDSKKISEKKRYQFFEDILEYAYVAIYLIQASEIDKINIYAASRKAMEHAVQNLQEDIAIDYVLTDAMPLKDLLINHDAIIKGDQKSLSIAAASIVAKCVRDTIMIAYGKEYPAYGFEKHKGYGTKQHLLALKTAGVISGIHRTTYKPVRDVLIRQEQVQGVLAFDEAEI